MKSSESRAGSLLGAPLEKSSVFLRLDLVRAQGRIVTQTFDSPPDQELSPGGDNSFLVGLLGQPVM